jgi:hypothetical protein
MPNKRRSGLPEILERFDDTSRRHIAQLQSFPAEQWNRVGQFRVGDRIALEEPVGDIVWFFHLRLLGRLSASIKTLQGGTDAHRYLSEPCCSLVPDAL